MLTRLLWQQQLSLSRWFDAMCNGRVLTEEEIKTYFFASCAEKEEQKGH